MAKASKAMPAAAGAARLKRGMPTTKALKNL